MKQEFNFKKFVENLNSQISETWKYVDDIEQMNFYSDNESEEDALNLIKLEDAIFELHLKIIFALEYLGLTTLLEKFKEEFDKYKGKTTTLEMLPYVGIMYSPVVDLIYKFKNVINCQFEDPTKKNDENKYDLPILERILRGTAKIMTDRKVLPENEAVVQREIFNTLIHVFPDTVREIPIPKISKTYKPDIGVKHLKCAIEYKFVDSEAEAKSCIGGIFEDMMGYEGTDDWKTFFAVIYMTDHFLTQDQVESEFRLSKAKKNWKPILVFGKGGRKKLSRKKKDPLKQVFLDRFGPSINNKKIIS